MLLIILPPWQHFAVHAVYSSHFLELLKLFITDFHSFTHSFTVGDVLLLNRPR